MLRLPSGRLLQYYKNSVPQKSGLNDEVLQWMEQEAKKLDLSEFGKCGGIVLDEMSIQVRSSPIAQYLPKRDRIFVNSTKVTVDTKNKLNAFAKVQENC